MYITICSKCGKPCDTKNYDDGRFDPVSKCCAEPTTDILEDCNSKMENLYEYKNSFVESCYIEYHESGIISVLFDLRKRWLPFGRSSDLTYWFEDEEGKIVDISLTKEQLKIKELPEGEFYLHYHNQEKDQVEFIYVPSNLMKINK